VDFELSDDQLALKEGVQAFCQSRFSSEKLHELADSQAMTRQLWGELAEMGVFSLGLPEELGGAGLGWVEAVVVFEELGKYLVPGPLAATYLLAMQSKGAANKAAIGEEIATLAVAGEAPHFIEHPELANAILVEGEEEVGLVDGPASRQLLEQAEVVPALDPLTPVAKLDAPLPPGEILEGAWQQGATLVSAQQLGLAAGALEQAVAYAGERKQFGKSIGQFQAVKHLCADMLTAVEVARAAVYYAGALLDDPDIADVGRAVSVARITASEAAELCGRHCVQIHGGMGYTWEMDAHLFLKRAWVLDTVFGTADTHAEKLAAFC